MKNNTKTWQDLEGWFNFPDLYTDMVNMHKDLKDVVFVEVGTWMGKSTCFMGSTIKEANANITFYGVDSFKGSLVDSSSVTDDTSNTVKHKHNGDFFNKFMDNVESCNLTNIITPIRKPSLEAVSDFEDGSIDFIFIDAEHTYKAVSNDLSAWYSKVKNGGILCGHDFDHLPVKNAVIDFATKMKLIVIPISRSSWHISKPK